MKLLSFALAACAAFLVFAEEGLAHGVNVFAFVDGDEIQVECGFSRSQRVKNGKLAITDSVTGDAVHEGVTDERGIYRFRPSEAFLASGHGLSIRLYAGEGHQDDWKVAPEELTALSGGGQTGTPAEIEAIVARVLDAKLAPINQALARQQDDAPGLRDIIGGIGWILGLLGLAAYMKYRR